MKIKVPAKTVDVCDVCKRETPCPTTCLVCGKEYCVVCRSYLPGCILEPNVCKNCDDRDDVIAIVKFFAKDFSILDKKRARRLSAIRRGWPKAPLTPKKTRPDVSI